MYKIHRTKSSIERADKHGPRKCEEAYIDVCGLWLCLKKDPTFPDALLSNPIASAPTPTPSLSQKHLHACAHAPPRSSMNKRLPIPKLQQAVANLALLARNSSRIARWRYELLMRSEDKDRLATNRLQPRAVALRRLHFCCLQERRPWRCRRCQRPP